MKTRPKQRKSASNKSSIVQGFFQPKPISPHLKIGGLRNTNKLDQILKKINQK